MQARARTFPQDGIWRPLSLRSFAFVGLVLALGLLAFDFALNGPVAWTAAQWLVVAPAERDWGFHAEWKDYKAEGSREESFLTIVRVTNGGAFERAGIKAGMAFAPRHSASMAPYFGGLYSVFVGARNAVRIRMLDTPDDPKRRWVEHTYDITR